ncbi:MAG: phospho-N-acetylmuramoyl-pentapeptide-transferase [Bacteroidales bacterium]|nr:phospho-N-acetylmuramoyl-pentapeptide-transferase [Bacteroidales bacterium]
MIYHLFEYLRNAGVDFPGVGIFSFLTTRFVAACVTSLLVAVFAGKGIIRFLQRKQIGEEIRNLGLEGQLQKKGTPTMGGVIIIVSILAGVLLFSDLTNIYNLLLIFTTLWFGALGFADDYIKVFKGKKEGMSERGKLIGQFTLGLVIALTVCFNSDIRIQTSASSLVQGVSAENAELTDAKPVNGGETMAADVLCEARSTKTTIPFVKTHEFDYGWLLPFRRGRWIVYLLMIVIVVMACSNCVNLTDGMDGLSSGTSVLVGVVLGVFAWLSGNIENADYLNIMYIPASGEVAVFMAAFVGALVGFLWYNSYPAQVFMGDTGSLTIGGIIGVGAVLIRKELLLPLLGGIFLVEGLSVIVQRVYFKYTKRKYGEGRRVLRMAPLHHHYQKVDVPAVINTPKQPLPEAKIVSRFWIIGVILAVLTLALLKLR